MSLIKLETNVIEREDWISASVENFEGDVIGESSAPVVEGATFDTRGAVIREATEQAIKKIAEDKSLAQ